MDFLVSASNPDSEPDAPSGSEPGLPHLVVIGNGMSG